MAFDRDHLNNLPARKAVDAAYCQLDSTQERTPAEQVAGTAILLVSYAEILRLDINELVHAALMWRKQDDIGTFMPVVSALDEYIREEIRK